MPIPRILWGPTFENVLDFGYPLFDVITDREPRQQFSRWEQGGSGVETAWIGGSDYTLQCNARFIPDGPNAAPLQSALSGPTGWQGFLDWARAKNVIRFVPDILNPLFFLDNVYLVDPLKGFGSLDSAIKRTVPLKFRNASVDFHQALRGVMFEYSPGASLLDPLVATIARSGAVGPFVGINGLAANAIANVLRDRHYPGTPGLALPGWAPRTALIEAAARTNLIENSDYEVDFVGTTANSGGTLARDQAHVFSGAWALKMTHANNNGDGFVWKKRDTTRMAAAAATAHTVSVWVFADSTAVGKNYNLNVDWWNATPALISTSTGPAVTLVAGWQRFTFTATSPAGTVTATPYFVLVGAQGVFSVWIDVPQFEASAFATSAIPTGTGAVTRNAETFSWPYAYAPQSIFILPEFIELGSAPLNDGSGPLRLGQGAGAFTRFDNFGANYRFQHNNGSAAVVSTAAGVPAIGQDVQLLGMIYPDGSVREKQSINGAAETDGGRSAANGFATAWVPQQLDLSYLGMFEGLIRIKIGLLTFGGVTRDTIAAALAA